jgi:dipeptide/tripeptide permease
MNLVWNAGWAVSATLSGMLIQNFGYAVPFSVTAVLYLAATLSFWLSFRHVREDAPAPVAGESLVTEEVKGARGQPPLAE